MVANSTDPNTQHHLLPVGGGTALATMEAGYEIGVPVFTGLRRAAANSGGRFVFNDFIRHFSSGAGAGAIVTMAINEGVKTVGGLMASDNTLIGDGVGEAIGTLGAMGVTRLAIAGLAVAGVTVEAPIALGAIGLAAVIGGDGGQAARDYSRSFRHFTDDTIGQNAINAVPASLREPTTRAFNWTMAKAAIVVDPVLNEAGRIWHDPLGEANRAGQVIVHGWDSTVHAVGNLFNGHHVAHAPEAHHHASPHTPPRTPAQPTAPRDRHAAAH